jgi:hypothetical protein
MVGPSFWLVIMDAGSISALDCLLLLQIGVISRYREFCGFLSVGILDGVVVGENPGLHALDTRAQRSKGK